jgi:hypothetical protein
MASHRGLEFNDFRSGKFGDIPRQARLKYL